MNPLSALVHFVKTYSTGVVAATMSVSFAGYMLISGGAGTGLNIGDPVAVRHVAVESPLSRRLEESITPARVIGDNRPLVNDDMLITGSVGKAAPKEPRLEAPRHSDKRPREQERADYVLRFATSDVALVEGSGRLWSVEPGDMLPGAGRVIRIEKRGRDRWVVKTNDGRTIREISSRQE